MTPPEALAEAGTAGLGMPAATLPPPRGGPAATVRKYSKIFRASLVERMTYRADFVLGTFLRFLPMLTTILLWQAIYAGAGKASLSGFRFQEMIAYLLLVNISR